MGKKTMSREEWLEDIGVNKCKSPRLLSLAEHFNNWFCQYSDEDFETDKVGMDIVAFAHDIRYHEALSFSLVSKNDPRESLVQAINHGIGDPYKSEKSAELFNGLSEYFARLYAEHPDLYERFQKAVKRYSK